MKQDTFVKNPAFAPHDDDHYALKFLKKIVAPLNVMVSDARPRSVNVVIGIIDFKYFFGGYISVFNLIMRLVREGYCLRAIIIDECPFEPLKWKESIRKYEGLEDFFEQVEVVYAYDRTTPVECSPGDAFMSTSWWSSYVADAAVKDLGKDRFVYLSQEYEPIFYNFGPVYMLSASSYDFSYYGVFSTDILRDFHRKNRIGLFKNDIEYGEKNSISFNNAVLKFNVDADAMKNRAVKKLLFYARPEEHATRNLFEIGMLSISKAIEDGAFDLNDWEFYGIGTINPSQSFPLTRGVLLKLLPKVSLNEYKEMMPGFDLGMSLMLSPHPSLVPIEMCAAGMSVVTNTYANKTKEVLSSISTNFVAAEPSVDGIAKALGEAAKRVYDCDARVSGSGVHWPQSWEEAFAGDFMERLKGFIGFAPEKGLPSAGMPGLRQAEPEGDSTESTIAMSYVRIYAKDPALLVFEIGKGDGDYESIKASAKENAASYLYFRRGRELVAMVDRVSAAAGVRLISVKRLLNLFDHMGMATRFFAQETAPSCIWVKGADDGSGGFQKEKFGVNLLEPSMLGVKGDGTPGFEVICLDASSAAGEIHRLLPRLYDTLTEDGVLILTAWIDNPVLRHFIEEAAADNRMQNLYLFEREVLDRDVFVFTRRYVPAINALIGRGTPVGAVDGVEVSRGGIKMQGWALSPEIKLPAKAVSVYYDGVFIGTATLGTQRLDVNEHFNVDQKINLGWEFLGGKVSSDVIGRGPAERIFVVIKDERGASACINALLNA
ncbi:MAG: hypothetical protein AABZ23_02500 [Deltaproteobacteria bacterium]